VKSQRAVINYKLSSYSQNMILWYALWSLYTSLRENAVFYAPSCRNRNMFLANIYLSVSLSCYYPPITFSTEKEGYSLDISKRLQCFFYILLLKKTSQLKRCWWRQMREAAMQASSVAVIVLLHKKESKRQRFRLK